MLKPSETAPDFSPRRQSLLVLRRRPSSLPGHDSRLLRRSDSSVVANPFTTAGVSLPWSAVPHATFADGLANMQSFIAQKKQLMLSASSAAPSKTMTSFVTRSMSASMRLTTKNVRRTRERSTWGALQAQQRLEGPRQALMAAEQMKRFSILREEKVMREADITVHAEPHLRISLQIASEKAAVGLGSHLNAPRNNPPQPTECQRKHRRAR